MKKILTLVCCTILLAATSCTKKYITPANRTIFFTVKGGTNPGGWVLTNNGGSPAYQTTLGGNNGDLPELDSFTQHNGAVLVYFSYDLPPNAGTTYEAIPENFAGTSFSFIHSTNTITITSQSSNGNAAVLPTKDIYVKVVLIDSEPQD